MIETVERDTEAQREAPAGYAGELRAMLRLAVPVALAELGWMAMSIVDTMCVGRLSTEAIGAVGLGHSVFFIFTIVGIGLLLGLDTLISQSLGAGRGDDARVALVQGLFLALGISLPLMAGIELVAHRMGALGLDPDVLPLAVTYLRVDNLSLPPLMVYVACRRYLQAVGMARSIVFALVSANLINLAGNFLLIFGGLGAPALGAVGSAWATVGARVWMAGVLIAALAWYERREGRGLASLPWRFDRRRFRGLIALGLPAATQLLLEMGVFSLATFLAARLGKTPLAAHQVALQVASTTYMVPLGISSAAAVRVGHAIGRGDHAGASRAGWTALALGAAFMLTASAAFILLPRTIIGGFTDQPEVFRAGVSLLGVAALFQLFDGLQVVATGALRGAGDTRTPMITSLVCYWQLALPIAYVLAFPVGWGVTGLWLGLSVGLMAVAMTLVATWARTSRDGSPRTTPPPVRLEDGPAGR